LVKFPLVCNRVFIEAVFEYLAKPFNKAREALRER